MRSLLLVVLLATPGRPARADVAGLPLPQGSRAAATADLYLSGRGFRDTVEFFARHLKRHGLAARAVPVERRRGVTVARFLADPVRRWRAIHVFQSEGRTYIHVVEAAPATEAAGTAPGS